MALIGSVTNQGSLQGEINNANGYLTGVISDASLLGGRVVGMRGMKGDKGDKGDTGASGQDGADGKDGQDGHTPVITASKVGKVTTVYVDGDFLTEVDDGNDGQNGADGHDGADGQDGFSPSASVSKVGDTATITITDENGTTTASVSDGADGTNGQDGYSPSASVSKVGDTATITITDENGTTTASVKDGANGTNGTNGQDGVSPTATVSKVGDTATITITDKNGTTTATVSDGADGAVQDVTVGGTSVLDGTVAKVPALPTKTSDLNNDSDFVSTDENGNLFLSGTISTAGYTDPLGWYTATSHSGTGAQTSLSSGTSFQKLTGSGIEMGAGRYIVIGSIRFATSSTGSRGLGFGASSIYTRFARSQGAISTNPTYLQTVGFLAPASTTTYNLWAYQNSGSSLGIEWYFYVIRIR